MAYPVELFIQESKSGSAFFVCEGADLEKAQALPTPTPEELAQWASQPTPSPQTAQPLSQAQATPAAA